MLNIHKLNEALTLLGTRLELNKASPINIIVCGGSSLIITGLVSRTTRDVDVLGIMHPSVDCKKNIEAADPLPEQLKKAAVQVSKDLGLDENWLNPGPADLVKYGLPDGFVERLQIKNQGRQHEAHGPDQHYRGDPDVRRRRMPFQGRRLRVLHTEGVHVVRWR